MNTAKLLGVFTGVFVGIVIVAILLKLTKTDKSRKCRYDERQQLIRGTAYRYGFFSMMVINVLAIIFDSGEMPLPVESGVIHYVSILVGVGVYASYCILKDSYFALNENKKVIMLVFCLVGIINFCGGILQIAHGNMIENGVVNSNCINFLCGILFIVIFIILLVKSAMDKREDD